MAKRGSNRVVPPVGDFEDARTDQLATGSDPAAAGIPSGEIARRARNRACRRAHSYRFKVNLRSESFRGVGNAGG